MKMSTRNPFEEEKIIQATKKMSIIDEDDFKKTPKMKILKKAPRKK